jgi:hypothetical protein
MGASYDGRNYDLNKMSMVEVKEQWNEAVESSLYEDGHEYSGGIGMLGKGFSISNFVAENEEEADHYIVEHHEKWNGAMGVKTKDEKIVIGGWCSS